MKTMSSERIRFYKEKFPKGTRVQLDRMGDDPNPIPNGTKGTVTAVDDAGTVSAILTMEDTWECVPKWTPSIKFPNRKKSLSLQCQCELQKKERT